MLSDLGVDPERVRREVAMLDEHHLRTLPDAGSGEGAEVTVFEARVGGLEVHARCGVSDEERALPQVLLVDLKYSYEAGGEDDVAGVVDYGVLLEGTARVLEREEFKLLETGVRVVGRHVLDTFPAVRGVTVSITKLRVPVARSLSGVTVSATFRQ